MPDIIQTDNLKTRHFYIYRNINIPPKLTQQANLSHLNYNSRLGIKGQLRNVNVPTSVSPPFEFFDEIIVKIKRWHSHLLIHYISTRMSI